MKVISLTKNVEEQYKVLFEKAINGIKAFKSDNDTAKFKKVLCDIIDKMPNVSYLDPDILYASYDMEYDNSQWCEFDDEEMKLNNEALKDIVNDIDDFQRHQLSLGGSGSILITLFGDTYHELIDNDLFR